MLLSFVVVAQLAALSVLCIRLVRGRHRAPPVEPIVGGVTGTSVSVVVPARNEAQRIAPCLAGLAAQGAPLAEVIIVDGGSTDGTRALVAEAAGRDPRVRLLDEPPRPPGLVGRPWAISAGCAVARGDWIMIVDADTAPRPGMIAGAVSAAQRLRLDVVSFAPRIIAPGAGARWLQPAFLTTLIYRFGAAGMHDADPERVMANGQCFLVRREVLQRAGGYEVAAASYADDVRIARHLARHGARVGFLDGPRLLDVTMYATAIATWRGWPASLNLRDASTTAWRWLDAVFLLLTQAAPLPMLLLIVLGLIDGPPLLLAGLAGINSALLTIRLLIAVATAHSFARRGAPYWLSPLADPMAVARVIETMIRRPREWRGTPRVMTDTG